MFERYITWRREGMSIYTKSKKDKPQHQHHHHHHQQQQPTPTANSANSQLNYQQMHCFSSDESRNMIRWADLRYHVGR